VSNSRIAPPAGLGASGGDIHAQVLDSIIRLSLNEVAMMGNSAETGGALSFVSDYGDIVATLTKSVFKNNTARGLGGAIRVDARGVPARLSIEDSRFENNRAGTGGAVSMRVVGNGRLDIARSIFARNAAILATGGAIDVWSDDLILAGTGAGTAVLTMENCVLQDNRAAERGGAIALRAFVPVHPAPEPLHARVEVDLRNNTIAANRASSGGGLAAIPYEVDFPGATALVTGTLLNNIIRGNTATGLKESGDILLLPQGDSAAVDLDLITNDIGKVVNLGATLTLTPDPQLDVDPKLVKTMGVFRLSATSPMIDAGTCDGAPTDDFEGDARPAGSGLCGVDIGADQF
jgi:hypothetical protein